MEMRTFPILSKFNPISNLSKKYGNKLPDVLIKENEYYREIYNNNQQTESLDILLFAYLERNLLKKVDLQEFTAFLKFNERYQFMEEIKPISDRILNMLDSLGEKSSEEALLILNENVTENPEFLEDSSTFLKHGCSFIKSKESSAYVNEKKSSLLLYATDLLPMKIIEKKWEPGKSPKMCVYFAEELDIRDLSCFDCFDRSIYTKNLRKVYLIEITEYSEKNFFLLYKESHLEGYRSFGLWEYINEIPDPVIRIKNNPNPPKQKINPSPMKKGNNSLRILKFGTKSASFLEEHEVEESKNIDVLLELFRKNQKNLYDLVIISKNKECNTFLSQLQSFKKISKYFTILVYKKDAKIKIDLSIPNIVFINEFSNIEEIIRLFQLKKSRSISDEKINRLVVDYSNYENIFWKKYSSNNISTQFLANQSECMKDLPEETLKKIQFSLQKNQFVNYLSQIRKIYEWVNIKLLDNAQENHFSGLISHLIQEFKTSNHNKFFKQGSLIYGTLIHKKNVPIFTSAANQKRNVFCPTFLLTNSSIEEGGLLSFTGNMIVTINVEERPDIQIYPIKMEDKAGLKEFLFCCGSIFSVQTFSLNPHCHIYELILNYDGILPEQIEEVGPLNFKTDMSHPKKILKEIDTEFQVQKDIILKKKAKELFQELYPEKECSVEFIKQFKENFANIFLDNGLVRNRFHNINPGEREMFEKQKYLVYQLIKTMEKKVQSHNDEKIRSKMKASLSENLLRKYEKAYQDNQIFYFYDCLETDQMDSYEDESHNQKENTVFTLEWSHPTLKVLEDDEKVFYPPFSRFKIEKIDKKKGKTEIKLICNDIINPE